MYIPSYDFRIFDLPMFSPLQAQEFGASTSFSANTPTSYIDNSLNQFAALLNPRNLNPYPQNQFPTQFGIFDPENFFQSTGGQTRAQIEAEVAKTKAAYEKAKADVTAPKTCPEGYKPVSVFGIFSYCGKGLHSDDTKGVQKSEAGAALKPLETLLNGLPPGAGIFLIAIVVIILLFLFVKR
jgi:hypothetical protein